MKNNLLIAAAVIILGVFGFLIGVKFQGRFLTQRFLANRQFAYNGMPMMRGRMMGWNGSFGHKRGILQGQVLKIEGDNLTVTRPDGTTFTVTLSDQTIVNRTSKAMRADLKTGDNVSVYTVPSANSVYSAQTVIINP